MACDILASFGVMKMNDAVGSLLHSTMLTILFKIPYSDDEPLKFLNIQDIVIFI
jgi:hypothetical protein